MRIAREQSYKKVCPLFLPCLQEDNTNGRFRYLHGYRCTRDVISQIRSAQFYQRGPLLLNMPKLPLDRLPELEQTKQMDWLETHAAMTYSARQRRMRHISHTSNDGLLNVTNNLYFLFVGMSAASLSLRSGRIFGLCYQESGTYTLILVSSIRLDLSAHTVVADVHRLPLTYSVIRSISRFLGYHHKEIRNLQVSDEGLKMWSSVLAVSVERCRVGIWKHKKGCEYKKAGMFPISTKPVVLPLYSCRRGKASSAITSCRAYEALLPYVY